MPSHLLSDQVCGCGYNPASGLLSSVVFTWDFWAQLRQKVCCLSSDRIACHSPVTFTMSSEKEMETAPASPKRSPTLPFSFERDDQEPVSTALNDTDSTGAPGPAQDAQAAAPPLVFNELQGRTEEGQQQEQNEHASLGNQNLSLIVHGNQSLESPRDTFDPLHQLNQNAFAALNTLSGPAFRAQGSAYMVAEV